MTRWKVPLMRKTFLNDEETRTKLAEFVLKTERLSMGPMVEQFQNAFAKWQGRKYAVMVNSGSSANLALIRASLGVRNKTACISAVTWSTNVAPLILAGARVKAVDVNPETLATEEWTDFTTHILGYPSAPGYAEDCCESLGTEFPGWRTLASTFSFFVGHHLSTIEGGMVCTDDEELWRMLLMVRAHGWTRDLLDYKPTFETRFEFRVLGYNIRPTEIQGYLGLLQLPLLDDAISKREALFARFSAHSDLIPKRPSYVTRFSPMALPFICPPGERPRILKRFEEAGVETRPIVAGNIQRQPFWKGPKTHTPGADRIHDDGFYCALRPDLTEEECETIEGAMRDGLR